MREHLLHYFPFLKKEFRELEKSDIDNETTFKELFPDEEIDLSKLKAIALYQKQSNILYTVVVEKQKETVQKLDRRIIKNGKI